MWDDVEQNIKFFIVFFHNLKKSINRLHPEHGYILSAQPKKQPEESKTYDMEHDYQMDQIGDPVNRGNYEQYHS